MLSNPELMIHRARTGLRAMPLLYEGTLPEYVVVAGREAAPLFMECVFYMHTINRSTNLLSDNALSQIIICIWLNQSYCSGSG